MLTLSRIKRGVLAVGLATTALVVSSCSLGTYGLDQAYKELPPKPYQPLPKGKTPQVLYALDPVSLVKRYEAAGYVVIGVAETVQELIPYGAVTQFAESKKASVVITSDYYERTDKEKRVRPVTETYTTSRAPRLKRFRSSRGFPSGP